ncbi:hypothetical protein AK812_SmicGene18785 [Symbiodinium microadriaticum]|uniref:Uncharacterized protein n=1 Tax=Symbiodinium microadriaticum TaxID=2951 RepID=A0A1Q9DU87_SYMMI|nr:hypothetical protein AK812_SmicGene18785 [Symbiodinium microadriaticum]
MKLLFSVNPTYSLHCSSFLGFLFSILAAVVKQLGALLQSIVGLDPSNLNLILVIVLSQAWLHEKVTLWQYAGVTLLAAGTFCSMDRVAPKKAQQPTEMVVPTGTIINSEYTYSLHCSSFLGNYNGDYR